MKKLIIVTMLLVASLCVNAQLFKGIELGGSVACSHQFREKGGVNVCADFRAYKSVTDWSRLRAEVGVNGILHNGLDRYGYGVVGVAVELNPAYAFGGFGLSCNPSGAKVIGMAFDCGLGLRFFVTPRCSVYSELSLNRINSAEYWQTTHFVKAGATYKL